jgi:hypothetical protein
MNGGVVVWMLESYWVRERMGRMDRACSSKGGTEWAKAFCCEPYKRAIEAVVARRLATAEAGRRGDSKKEVYPKRPRPKTVIK